MNARHTVPAVQIVYIGTEDEHRRLGLANLLVEALEVGTGG